MYISGAMATLKALYRKINFAENIVLMTPILNSINILMVIFQWYQFDKSSLTYPIYLPKYVLTKQPKKRNKKKILQPRTVVLNILPISQNLNCQMNRRHEPAPASLVHLAHHFFNFRAYLGSFTSWQKKATIRAELKILRLELRLEPARLGLINSR